MFDVCAACETYTRPHPARHHATDLFATDGIVRATLGRVDAALYTLRAAGETEAAGLLSRSLRALLAVDEARHA